MGDPRRLHSIKFRVAFNGIRRSIWSSQRQCKPLEIENDSGDRDIPCRE